MRREHKAAIDAAVEERIVTALVGEHAGAETKTSFRKLYRCEGVDGWVGEWCGRGRVGDVGVGGWV